MCPTMFKILYYVDFVCLVEILTECECMGMGEGDVCVCLGTVTMCREGFAFVHGYMCCVIGRGEWLISVHFHRLSRDAGFAELIANRN